MAFLFLSFMTFLFYLPPFRNEFKSKKKEKRKDIYAFIKKK